MTETIPLTSRDELKAKLDRKERFVLIDALTPEYFTTSHLPGALNLPLNLAKSSAAKMLPDKDAEIVVYCMSPS